MGVQPINNNVLAINCSNCALELKGIRADILSTKQQAYITVIYTISDCINLWHV